MLALAAAMDVVDMAKADLSDADLDNGGRANPERLCDPGQEYDAGLGRCVTRLDRADDFSVSPEGRLVALQWRLDRIERAQVRRQTEPLGVDTLGNRQVADREEEDQFLALELLLAIALAESAFATANKFIFPLYGDQVLPTDSTKFNQARLDDANDLAATRWQQQAWTPEVNTRTRTVVQRAFLAGEAQITPGIARDAPSVQRVLDDMVDLAQWSTNQYFNQQVMPSLQRQINNAFENADAFTQADFTPIRTALDARLKSVPYWRVVANAATSRSYHYGLLKAAQFQGFRGYEFKAIIDEKTTDICRSLDGKVWSIASALNKYEQVAGSDDPDEVKRVFPWTKFQDVQGLSVEELQSMGVMVPPLHGNCRSTLTPRGNVPPAGQQGRAVI